MKWANATAIYLIGDFNGWQETEDFRLLPLGDNGNWEIKLPARALSRTALQDERPLARRTG